MFLRFATVIAIIGIGLSLVLSLIQQAMFAARFYSAPYFFISRLISLADILLFYGSLLVFFVAFLLSLKSKAQAAGRNA